MESKHTPGPWRIGGKHSNGAVVIRGAEATSEVAIVLQNDQQHTADVNADLIAAAPDLLEALQGLLKRFESIAENACYYDEYTDSYAAIGKAVGDIA